MRISQPNKAKRILIGRLGDDNSMRVIFDVSKWIEDLGEDGEWSALCLQPNTTVAYVPTGLSYSSADKQVWWDLQASEMTEDGDGTFQLIYKGDSWSSVSAQYTTRINKSLFINESTVPTVYQAFYDSIVQIDTDVKNAKEATATSEANAKTSEINAKTSEINAKTSETNAKTSETNAEESAERAEQAAESKGFIYVDGEDGILYAHTSDNFGDDLRLADDGNGVLEVILS